MSRIGNKKLYRALLAPVRTSPLPAAGAPLTTGPGEPDGAEAARETLPPATRREP